MCKYPILKELQSGKIVEIEGFYFKMVPGKIVKGDLYIAQRNSNAVILCAKSIDEEDGYIVPTTIQYSFDIEECIKVVEVEAP